MVGVIFGFENLSTFGVVHDSFGNMSQEIGSFSSFFRMSPALGKDQPAVVQVGGSLRGQTNGRNCLGEFDGPVQRQDGDVVKLFYLNYPINSIEILFLKSYAQHSPNFSDCISRGFLFWRHFAPIGRRSCCRLVRGHQVRLENHLHLLD